MSSVIRLPDRYPRSLRSRWSIKRMFRRFRLAWAAIIASLMLQVPPDPAQPSPPNEPSPPLAKAAALREGTLLYEYVDARSNKHVA